MKKIITHFKVVDFTAEKYSQTIKDLEAAGKENPPGRLHHVAAQEAEGLLIPDVWESEEALNEFSVTLIPILEKNGVTPVQPTLLPVHNIIAGK